MTAQVTRGQTLVNPVTHESIVFRRTSAETGGACAEVDWFWSRPHHRTIEHIHPELEESWEVIVGRVRFKIGDRELTASEGDQVIAPPGTPHSAQNLGPGGAHLRVRFTPALGWESAIQRIFAYAREGKTDASGVMTPECVMALLRDFPRELAPAVRRSQ
jgi:mannose-6-phosphate isomerase-like protein (cupin superfamily)